MKFPTWVCLAAATLPQSCLGNSFTVETSNGLIAGHSAKGVSGVKEFLGIPYAQPPVGKLRFQPPQPYTGNRSFVASSFVSLDFYFLLASC